MKLFKELQKDYKSKILKTTTKFARYILNAGIVIFILGIITTVLYWKQFLFFPFLLGAIFLAFSYLKSLK